MDVATEYYRTFKEHLPPVDRVDHIEASAQLMNWFARRWRAGLSPQDDAELLGLVLRVIARNT